MSLADLNLPRRPVHPMLWFMVAAMIGIETLFWAVESGLTGPTLSRWAVIKLLAFHDPIFDLALWHGVISIQLIWSVLTYAFLHGGWLHLLMNMAAFLGLGHAITRVAGIQATLAIFLVSAVTGSVVFGLIEAQEIGGLAFSESILGKFAGLTFVNLEAVGTPLVGASGVVFGYLGILTAWQEQSLRYRGLPRTQIWQRLLGLVAINALLDFGLSGMLAWEAHLGGFIGGWLMASVYRPLAWR